MNLSTYSASNEIDSIKTIRLFKNKAFLRDLKEIKKAVGLRTALL
jgi:hypothetical protein